MFLEFLDLLLLVTSLFSEILSVVILFRLKFSKRYDDRILYLLLISIVFILMPLSFYNLLFIKQSLDLNMKVILSLIPLIVLTGLTLISKKSPISNQTTNLNRKIIWQSSLIIISLSLLGSIAMGYLGYLTVYNSIKLNIERQMISSSYSIKSFLENNQQKDYYLKKELFSYWNNTKPLDLSPEIYVFDHSLNLFFSSDFSSRTLNNDELGKLRYIQTIKKDYLDFIFVDNKIVLTSYVYVAKNNFIISIKIPENNLEAFVMEIVSPWIAAVVFITIIMLPLSISLLQWVYSFLQRQITEKNLALSQSLVEKEILLKEIHHRVKNNLQVVYSLIGLQSKQLKDDETVKMLFDTQQRIKSMAMIHEKLYQSKDLGRINFKEYITNLANYLLQSYNLSSNARLNLNLDEYFLDIDTAIPCGLILNELVSNSLKYNSVEGGNTEILITFSQNEAKEFILTIKDNGIGLPKDFDLKQAKSLGLKLVYTLVKQLRAKIEYQNNNGSEFRIVFSITKN